ncbi:MAG: 3-methyladenine DNA glycosylase AlkC [Oleispira sp.]|jgi:3-methyladenine DNA glycosylase AlkC
MAELFKDNLSLEKISTLASSIAEQGAQYNISFDEDYFQQQLTECCLAQSEKQWQGLSLMQRLRAAARALYLTMPQQEGADVVVDALQGNDQLSSWLSLVCCEYIAIHQNLNLEQGLKYLQKMTEFFSAEFAIRHFIIKRPKETLAILTTWLEHDNHHVRRLISEGTRPRLPWGMRLSIFIDQPELVMPLLLALRNDDAEYVRRSVANHLNDIAKDHPQLIITTAQQWLADEALASLNSVQRKQRVKLIRHACRTLFKQGEPAVMALFGYQPAHDVNCHLSSDQLMVPFGGHFEFEMTLEKNTTHASQLMVDYVMHFQKANGKQAPKVFKWLDRSLTDTTLEKISRKHSFKKISTRKYYPGTHRLEVMVNGIIKAQIEFELLADSES